MVYNNVRAGEPPLAALEEAKLDSFFKMNPSPLDFVIESAKSGLELTLISHRLRAQFPDDLHPFEQTPLARTVRQLMDLTRFFQRVENDPEQFPSTHRFLSFVRDLQAKREAMPPCCQ